MGAHAVVHRRPDVSLKSALAQLRGAPKQRPCVEQRRVTWVQARVVFASMVITTPHRPWVSESELEAQRARTLMEDNPTSG
jgi:hypothetical protein